MAEQKRMTVTFLAPTVEDIEWLTGHTGVGQADVINKAVKVYAMIERELADGGKRLAFESVSTGATERIIIV